MTDAAERAPAFVEAELSYLKPSLERPVSYAFPPPPGVPVRTGEVDPRRVRIIDARTLPTLPTLDEYGFELRHGPSALTDFSDERAIRERYYPESEALIREATGASKVVIFDHTLRYGKPEHGEEGVREPVRRVHNDQTFLSAPRRVRDHLPREEAESRLARRFAIINLWRPIGHAAESTPLALCDARTISPRALVPSDLVYRDKVGETYSFTYDPEHRWLYFSRVTPDEYLLLKIYDARVDGSARLTAHTAFDDPTTPPNARPRESIEIRTLAFF